MQLVAQGDKRAQRVLASRLVGRVRRAAGALMRGSPDADDAAQTALIEILRSAKHYRGDSAIERWSDRITGRSVIRYARQMRRRQSTIETGLDPEAVRVEKTDARMSEDVPREIRDYLERLPEVRREVLVLKHALGHSVDEIAEITGTSPNTVKDRLLAARREVRRMIQRDRAIGVRRREGTS